MPKASPSPNARRRAALETRPQTTPAASTSQVWRAVYLRGVSAKAGLVGVLAFYAMAMAIGVGALWPPLQDTFVTIAGDLPAAFDSLLGGLSIATPAGWLNAELLSIVGPGFAIAAAMISGAGATVEEEQSRTLSLLLSTGIRRSTFLAGKTAALVTHVLMVGIALLAGMLIAESVGNLGLPISGLIAATVNIMLIALLAGAITLMLGVLTADKRLTLAITGVLFGASFIVANFLGLNESLVWLSKLNLWYLYLASPVLVTGIDWGYAGVMLGLTVGIGGMAFYAFPRRGDLRG